MGATQSTQFQGSCSTSDFSLGLQHSCSCWAGAGSNHGDNHVNPGDQRLRYLGDNNWETIIWPHGCGKCWVDYTPNFFGWGAWRFGCQGRNYPVGEHTVTPEDGGTLCYWNHGLGGQGLANCPHGCGDPAGSGCALPGLNSGQLPSLQSSYTPATLEECDSAPADCYLCQPYAHCTYETISQRNCSDVPQFCQSMCQRYSNCHLNYTTYFNQVSGYEAQWQSQLNKSFETIQFITNQTNESTNQTIVKNSPYEIVILTFTVSNTIGILFILLSAACYLSRRRAKIHLGKTINPPMQMSSKKTRADIRNAI